MKQFPENISPAEMPSVPKICTTKVVIAVNIDGLPLYTRTHC